MNDRITRERKALGLKPWEFAPSEIDDNPCPYSPGSAGALAWEKALELKRQLEEQRERLHRQ